jgi:hypothetical protein
VVAIPSLFMNLTEVTDLTSIGTLFAFVLVSGGVLILLGNKGGRFVPYINSRWIVPVLLLLVAGYFIFFQRASVATLLDFSNWSEWRHRIPLLVFLVLAGVLGVLCFIHQLSLIPVMGLLTCGYLMTELGIVNWIRFLLWLLAGLVIYFFYGYGHSNLGRRQDAEAAARG